MKRKMITFLVIVLLSFFGTIRSNEPVYQGEELEMHVNVVNDLKEDLEEVSLNVLFYDLGIQLGTNSFDVEDRDSVSKLFYMDTSDIPPGEYLARFTLSNEDFREVKHRYILII